MKRQLNINSKNINEQNEYESGIQIMLKNNFMKSFILILDNQSLKYNIQNRPNVGQHERLAYNSNLKNDIMSPNQVKHFLLDNSYANEK